VLKEIDAASFNSGCVRNAGKWLVGLHCVTEILNGFCLPPASRLFLAWLMIFYLLTADYDDCSFPGCKAM
jgi:hypothetical protein